MVKLPDDYCIDSTEVTRGQYQAWLDSSPDPATAIQSPLCAGNTSFVPDPACIDSTTVCQGAGCEDHPMVCVDYCDAYAYCRAVGKSLCGKLGGGPIRDADYGDATLSEWYNACLYGGAQTGTDYCNTVARLLDATVAVASLTDCVTTAPGYEGVYDLSGNVYEIVDECDTTLTPPHCLARGGSYSSYYASCTTDNRSLSIEGASVYFGFRCCAP